MSGEDEQGRDETDAAIAEVEGAEARQVDAAGSAAEGGPTTEREQELLERLQRVSADYANYQKRVQRDKAKWTQDAIRGLLKDLLPVLDTLDSALAAFAGEVKDPSVYRQGVELVREELMRQLGNYDVTRVHAEPGAPYDLDAHEAIMVQEADDVTEKLVAFVARAGYRLGDVVLRPAQVGVKQPRS
ncbi:MAG: nucleotide exchange factor GrpE [Planctomycetota bacterium]